MCKWTRKGPLKQCGNQNGELYVGKEVDECEVFVFVFVFVCCCLLKWLVVSRHRGIVVVWMRCVCIVRVVWMRCVCILMLCVAVCVAGDPWSCCVVVKRACGCLLCVSFVAL